MTRLRKLILAALAALALLQPLGTPPAAHAGSGHGQQRLYYLYYRLDPHSPWYLLGYTYDLNLAQYYVQILTHYYGVEAFVY